MSATYPAVVNFAPAPGSVELRSVSPPVPGPDERSSRSTTSASAELAELNRLADDSGAEQLDPAALSVAK